MHPAIIEWWKAQHAHGCGPWACGGRERGGGRTSCGPGYENRHDGDEWGGGGGDGGDGGSFGVRRPLRFLAYKLQLDDRQVAELARVLNELKTERAQAEVDRRRTVSAFADAVAGDAFDGGKANEGGALRVASAEKLRTAVVKALQEIHAMLDGDQRAKLAYLIRTGTLAI